MKKKATFQSVFYNYFFISTYVSPPAEDPLGLIHSGPGITAKPLNIGMGFSECQMPMYTRAELQNRLTMIPTITP